MNPQIYQVLHVVGVILLFAFTFSAFAAPTKERKRRLAMLSGIAAVVALVAAFGLISKLYGNNFTGWMIAKMIIWLVIAALSGIVFSKPSKAGIFSWIVAVLGVLAVYLVYTKPVIFGF